MTTNAIFTLGLFLSTLFIFAFPLGLYMHQVLSGELSKSKFFVRFEHKLYAYASIDQNSQMSWKQYAIALMIFNIIGVIFVYILQRTQIWLPLNPQNIPNVSADSAWNTAISFVTNTNWQGYAGENTLSYLTQMLGLSVQNFFSAATGITVALALIRGFSQQSLHTIGNFWVDITRSTIYILLPLSIILSIIMVQQGTIQNFLPYQAITTLEKNSYQQPIKDPSGNPVKSADGHIKMETVQSEKQVIPMGPVASQEAIKLLGTNGGGFFNANSAHPYENPTPLTNFLQMLAIFIIPTGLCFTFGKMVGDQRQGWALLWAMSIIFITTTSVLLYFEQQGNPIFAALDVDTQNTSLQSGGNMEGKEVRFGITSSALFTAVTTAASCGAVNNMHDALTPLGGLIPTVLMQMGEVIFGGVGSGLYGMLIFAILAVFISGLMIGRTPEYLGKKIEIFEIKMTALVILMTPILVLTGTAITISLAQGKTGIFNPSAHGFTEVLYAFSSVANNNGSAFAGLSANTPFYNVILGFAMWFGRFAIIIPILAMAGSLSQKKRLLSNVGMMPTHGPLFIILLIGTILLIGALNYVPALALGPVIEQLQMSHP